MLLYCLNCKERTEHKQHSYIRRVGHGKNVKWMVEMVCTLCASVKDCDFSQKDFFGKGVSSMQT